MKKILVMFLALVMAVSMLACASAATELKWASVHPPEQVVTQMMMRAIDERALTLGLRCIRTDTHRKNKAMQRLLRESGYRYRGNLRILVEPGHDPARQAYEKIIKIRK